MDSRKWIVAAHMIGNSSLQTRSPQHMPIPTSLSTVVTVTSRLMCIIRASVVIQAHLLIHQRSSHRAEEHSKHPALPSVPTRCCEQMTIPQLSTARQCAALKFAKLLQLQGSRTQLMQGVQLLRAWEWRPSVCSTPLPGPELTAWLSAV